MTRSLLVVHMAAIPALTQPAPLPEIIAAGIFERISSCVGRIEGNEFQVTGAIRGPLGSKTGPIV